MDAKYIKPFVARVASKVKNADALGTKTTWTTEDHLRSVAEVLAEIDIPDGTNPADAFHAVLSDTYNVSAFAQYLEKKFAGTGHFVRRDGKKVPSTDAFAAALEQQMKPAATPTA